MYYFCKRGRSGLDLVDGIRCFLAHDLSRLRRMKDFDEGICLMKQMNTLCNENRRERNYMNTYIFNQLSQTCFSSYKTLRATDHIVTMR